MRSGTRVVLGAMVLLVAASIVYMLTRDEPGEDGATAAIQAPADSPGSRGMVTPEPVAGMPLDATSGDVRSLAVPSNAPSTEGTPAAPDVPRTRLSGRVTYALDGRPAVGERLTILWEPADPEAERIAHPELSEDTLSRAELRDALQMLGAGEFETTTDSDGRYDFTLPDVVRSAVRLAGIDVAAGPTTPRQMIHEERVLVPGTDAVFDFTLVSGCVLEGSVVDTHGRPVPGAEVHGWTDLQPGMRPRTDETPDQIVRTDGSGAYRMEHLGESATLAAYADGLAPHVRLNGSFPLGEITTGLELMVSEERQVVGMVVSGGGQPIEGVLITLSSEVPVSQRITQNEGVFGMAPPTRTATSGPGGRFQLNGLCQRNYRARAEYAQYQEWTGTHAPGDGELVIELTAGLSLTGTVRGPGGDPLAGARVLLGSGENDDLGNRGFTRTDEDGRFVFETLERDPGAFVVARAEGHAVHVVQPVVIEQGSVNHVDVVLRRERVLAGVVVDVDGNSVEGATLSLEGDRLIDHGSVSIFPKPTWESQLGAVKVRTDSEGAFRIGNLYDGMFRLEAVTDSGSVRAVMDVRSGRDDLRIVLDPNATVGVTLLGTARDGMTGLPMQEKFFVTPMMPGAAGSFGGTSHGFEDPEGRYRVTALEAGPILINASAAGYAPWSVGKQTLENGEHHFDIDFLPTRRVLFHVVDGKGNPVVVNMSFKDEQGQVLMVEHGPGSRMSNLTTDKQGEAIGGGLPAAQLTVTVKRGWLGAQQEYLVDLRPEPRGPIELVYGEPEVRTVLVLLVSGTPTEPEPVGKPGWMIGRWLETQVKEGHLRPISVPVQIVATDETGMQVAQTALDPAGENAQAFPVEGVNAPFVAKLELPTKSLTIEASAEGHVSLQRSWNPESLVEIMVLVLPSG